MSPPLPPLGRAALVAVLSAGLPGACRIDRDRPGPPRLTITFDRDSLHNSDPLSSTVRASDVDGIDSIWLSVDSAPPLADDGLLLETYENTFQTMIRDVHLTG